MLHLEILVVVEITGLDQSISHGVDGFRASRIMARRNRCRIERNCTHYTSPRMIVRPGRSAYVNLHAWIAHRQFTFLKRAFWTASKIWTLSARVFRQLRFLRSGKISGASE